MHLSVFDLILLAGGGFYSLFAVWLLVGVERSRRATPTVAVAADRILTVSIIVAARNEAANVGACLTALAMQDYDGTLEVVVVDDHSQDGTAEAALAAAQTWPDTRRLQIVQAPDPPLHAGPKKNALAGGIAASKGELLLFTDADCEPPPRWATSMVASFADETVGLVAGYADRRSDGFLQAVLAVDDLGIGALGEGGLGHGVALSCTGRSLAYRRRVYDEVAGFDAIGHLISGDDVYFLRHVAATSSTGLRYNADPAAVVRDGRAREGLAAVVQRKLRHASKASRYEGAARWLGIGIYAYHAMLAAGLWQALVGGSDRGLFAIVWGARWVLDLLLLWRFAPRACDRQRLLYLPFVEFLYIPYVLFFIPIARIVGFRWRDTSSPR